MRWRRPADLHLRWPPVAGLGQTCRARIVPMQLCWPPSVRRCHHGVSVRTNRRARGRDHPSDPRDPDVALGIASAGAAGTIALQDCDHATAAPPNRSIRGARSTLACRRRSWPSRKHSTSRRPLDERTNPQPRCGRGTCIRRCDGRGVAIPVFRRRRDGKAGADRDLARAGAELRARVHHPLQLPRRSAARRSGRSPRVSREATSIASPVEKRASSSQLVTLRLEGVRQISQLTPV